jgi:putative spermidine/putrescine transport system permease protein
MPDRVRRWLGAFSFLVCLFSVAPVAVIVLESFTATDYIVFPPQGLSFKWYVEFAKRGDFVDSALVSAVVALSSCLLATALGTMAALALERHQFPGRSALRALFMSPLSLPGIIFGLALLQFLAGHGLPRNTLALVLTHVVITMPFAIRFVSVSLLGIDPNVEKAARSLGADGWSTFWRVTFPLIRPGLVASVVFAFIISFDEVAASLFVSSPTAMTLPVRIFVYIDQNYDPLVTSVSSLLVFAAVIALFVIEKTVGMGRLFGLR